MSTSRKHEYRFKYLKSDEWLTVRAEALVREDACCQICGLRDLSNDAHHVAYPPSFWDTKAYHLVILCRPCHDLCHEILGFDGDKDHCLKRFLDVAEALKEWLSIIRLRLPPPTETITTAVSDQSVTTVQTVKLKTKKPSDYLREQISFLKAHREALLKEWSNICPNEAIPVTFKAGFRKSYEQLKPSDHMRNQCDYLNRHIKLIKASLDPKIEQRKALLESRLEVEHSETDYMFL